MKYLLQPPINCCRHLLYLGIFVSGIAPSFFVNGQDSFSFQDTVLPAHNAQPIPWGPILLKNAAIGMVLTLMKFISFHKHKLRWVKPIQD